MLLRFGLVAAVLFSSATIVVAETPTIPETAKKATKDEFIAFIDGKTVDVVIYDAEKPITATLKWDWKKKSITGNALVDGKDKIKVKVKWLFEGDQACSNDKKGCHDIFVDGKTFYEVKPDGSVHAVSTLK